MTTEQDIIYAIWETVRGGEISADDTITERLLRGYLRSHRGKHLGVFYDKGAFTEDECFQDLRPILFTKKGNEWQSNVMPKVIRLSNYGIAISKNGYPISIVDAEEFRTSQNHRHNKYHPKAKFINNRLSLYLGKEFKEAQLYQDFQGSLLNRAIRGLDNEARFGEIKLEGRAVLVDPDESPGYDFTSSPYPFPDELTDSLINSVTARDFNLYLRTRSDETTDNRDNNAEKNTREEF